MIRLATEDDDLTEMGARFFAATGLDKWFEFDPVSFRDSIRAFIRIPSAVVLVVETEEIIGFAAALAYPCWFNRNHLTAQEISLWVEPEHRGPASRELLNTLEDWAKKQGCPTFETGTPEAQKPELMERYYRMHGYEPKERLLCRRLEW